jgi:hypothetical protein
MVAPGAAITDAIKLPSAAEATVTPWSLSHNGRGASMTVSLGSMHGFFAANSSASPSGDGFSTDNGMNDQAAVYSLFMGQLLLRAPQSAGLDLVLAW